MNRISGFVFFTAGLLLAALAVHVNRTPPPQPDLTSIEACIGSERVQHRLDNQYQELVNALYSCRVYKLPVG